MPMESSFLDFSKLVVKKRNHITICQNNIILIFFRRSLVSHVKFSYLLKVSCQYHYWFWRYDIFFFYKGLTSNQKLETLLSEFIPKSEDWCEFGIRNLARMCLMKCYQMLQNGRVITYTVSELFMENQHGVKLNPFPHYI